MNTKIWETKTFTKSFNAQHDVLDTLTPLPLRPSIHVLTLDSHRSLHQGARGTHDSPGLRGVPRLHADDGLAVSLSRHNRNNTMNAEIWQNIFLNMEKRWFIYEAGTHINLSSPLTRRPHGKIEKKRPFHSAGCLILHKMIRSGSISLHNALEIRMSDLQTTTRRDEFYIPTAPQLHALKIIALTNKKTKLPSDWSFSGGERGLRHVWEHYIDPFSQMGTS